MMSGFLATNKTFQAAWMERALDFLAGDGVGRLFGKVVPNLLVPLIAVLIFLGLWSVGAKNVHTSLGQLPGPAKVWEQASALYQEHLAELRNR